MYTLREKSIEEIVFFPHQQVNIQEYIEEKRNFKTNAVTQLSISCLVLYETQYDQRDGLEYTTSTECCSLSTCKYSHRWHW
jgi:hypothetical protein